MLIRMDDLLQEASAGRYGVAAPNIWNLETIHKAMQVALELKSPIILDYAEDRDDGTIYQIGDIARFYAKKYPDVPVALNLDHGGSFESCARAIQAGFTSVMIDRSTEPFEENVRQTKEVCRMAHALNISVEAELGHVGQGVTYDADREVGLTKVEDASRFIEETGVDCLAVAVGTAHGRYIGTPHLDFERLAAIRAAVTAPLVLHGGSSSGDENLKKAVANGISKINLYTDLSVAACKEQNKYLDGADHPDLNAAYESAMKGYGDMLSHYIHLFGSTNKY